MSTDSTRWVHPLESDHPPVGWVVDSVSGSLGPLTLWHGIPLLRWATEALADAGVVMLDERTDWAQLAELEAPIVLGDIACPGLPASFVVQCVERAVAEGRPVVGVRAVTDTLKATSPLGATVDRDAVLQICAPVVLPPGSWGERPAPPTDLVSWVAGLPDVVRVEAPAAATRVNDPTALGLLETVSAASA